MKIGDVVSVLDEDLEGMVTSCQGDVVCFKDEFGFIHRYPKKEVVPKDKSLYADMTVNKKNETAKKIVSKKHNKNHLVLDLHFEKLVDNPIEFSSFERLFIQKKKLMDTLDFCRENRLKKLEIVHGIGDGTLQQMVVRVLENQVGLEIHHMEVLKQQSGNIMVFFQ